ncbi:UbiB domain [Arabidopsis thaliana x Arabidopsis arenosa]|uniref:UbiB domain n=1 Tax=Arabidopsis thaliana x Arabidopsis arenosa TaxID=1240361 RepID=A0A8T2BF06_9BRAS|nr:UbiB domain [Arabidopsis thaliana x Arabidopsis arenosa]
MEILRKFKFPGRSKSPIFAFTVTGLALTAVTSSAAAVSIFRDSPSNKIATAVEGVVRSSRAIYSITLTVADYKYSLRRLPADSDDYLQRLTEVHSRSAKRILKLCESNKGFYVKAGQFVATLKLVPKEYSLALSSLQDKAVPCNFQEIKHVLTSNLGQNFTEIFLSFDEEPIAAASIAQVHHAVLKNHQEVAVKVQYPGLKQNMKLDTMIMSFLSKSVAKIFPEYRFDWLVYEFVKSISQELDFIQEAKNSERIAKNFKHNKMITIPTVFWEFTTTQVLTMQFCKGFKVDDVESLKSTNVSPEKVAKVLVEVFAEMIFVHGFIHGDPHPGNILVSPGGQNGFSLVLLDHGNCKTLGEAFRRDFCRLWEALILLDSNKIQELGKQFGVGKYAKFFPVIFTGRTSESKSGLGKGMSIQERQKLKQELKLLRLEDVTTFMGSLPPDFLTVLRTDGLIRSITLKLGAPQRVRLLAYAKYAVYGLGYKQTSESDFVEKSIISRSVMLMSYLRLRFILELMELFQGMKKLKHTIYGFYGQLVGGITNSVKRITCSV